MEAPLNASTVIALYGQKYWDEYNGHRMIVTSICMLTFTTIFVILRFIARVWARSPLKWDDWLILPAWLCTAGLCIQGIRESTCTRGDGASENVTWLTSRPQ